MRKGEGKFHKYYKLPYYALIRLEVETDCDETRITTDCHGQGFYSQGYIEEVPADGYDSWKDEAISGVVFALEVADVQKAEVTITHIEGLSTDTNPTIVAAAAARALWNALEISVSNETEKNLENYVLQSWQKHWSYVATHNFLKSGNREKSVL
jgi:hypothetical protein